MHIFDHLPIGKITLQYYSAKFSCTLSFDLQVIGRKNILYVSNNNQQIDNKMIFLIIYQPIKLAFQSYNDCFVSTLFQ